MLEKWRSLPVADRSAGLDLDKLGDELAEELEEAMEMEQE